MPPPLLCDRTPILLFFSASLHKYIRAYWITKKLIKCKHFKKNNYLFLNSQMPRFKHCIFSIFPFSIFLFLNKYIFYFCVFVFCLSAFSLLGSFLKTERNRIIFNLTIWKYRPFYKTLPRSSVFVNWVS